MRILQVIDTLGPGGAEDVFVELAAACQRAGHETVAVVPGPGWITDALRRRSVPTETVASLGSFSLGYLRGLVRVARQHRIDVIHAHLFGAGIYSALAGAIARVPVVITFHGLVDVPDHEKFLAVKTMAARRAQGLVAVSEQLKTYLVPRLAVPADRIEVIANGIDTSRFLNAAPVDLHAKHGIPVGARIIGSVGNIRSAKAYDVGVRALRALRDAGTDAHWLIAGQPDVSREIMSALELEVRRLELEPYIHFLGFVDEPERFLASLDAFLLCSRSEGHPLALCQAMTAARPVVATRCGVEAFLTDGREGWLVPVGDSDAIAGALRSALTDGAAARGRAARDRALAEFDSRAVVERHLRLYARLTKLPLSAPAAPN